MRNWIIGVILIAIASWLLAPVAWWVFIVPALVVPLIFRGNVQFPFWMGFVALVGLYGINVIWTNLQNDSLLLNRISSMFQAPGWAIVLASLLIPALLAGLASSSSESIVKAIFKENVK